MAKKQCTVTIQGRRCTNTALPNRRTCGKHGKKASRSNGRRTKFVHLDCSVPALKDCAEPVSSTWPARQIPEEQPYLYGVAYRSDGSIINLPTNREQLRGFLLEWLRLPGHTVHLLEQLTPSMLLSRDAGLAAQICRAARNLVAFDLAGGAK